MCQRKKFNFNEIKNVEVCYLKVGYEWFYVFSTTIPFVIIKVFCIRKYITYMLLK